MAALDDDPLETSGGVVDEPLAGGRLFGGLLTKSDGVSPGLGQQALQPGPPLVEGVWAQVLTGVGKQVEGDQLRGKTIGQRVHALACGETAAEGREVKGLTGPIPRDQLGVQDRARG